jgi:GPN-loop GTPase
MVLFGQVVVGPPGAGKTTYCDGMQQFMKAMSRRVAVVNFDFANDSLPYECAVDVREFISLERVMEEFKLGPNGGLVYCMEYLLDNSSWLEERLGDLHGYYVLFDFPGQVELYTHHTCVTDLLAKLTNRRGLDCRLCSVHLVDSFYCCEPATFISATLLVAASMLQLGLPHINILSKVDLLKNYDNLPFNLSFYTELVDLTPMARYVGRPFEKLRSKPTKEDVICDDDGTDDGGDVAGETALQVRYRRMSEGICDVLTDLGLVSFLPLNIEDAATVGRVLADVDKANGFLFAATEAQEVMERAKQEELRTQNTSHFRRTGAELPEASDAPSTHQLFTMAAQNLEPSYMRSLDIQEKYIDPED